MNKFITKIPIKNIAIALVIAIFFIADRYLKLLALNSAESAPFRLIGNIFFFDFTANYQMAFSLPLGGVVLNVIVILIIICLSAHILYLMVKKSNKIIVTILTFILLGAISNILDRLIYGYVIDYLELKYFTVFNLADIMISVGAIILITLCCSKKSHI